MALWPGISRIYRCAETTKATAGYDDGLLSDAEKPLLGRASAAHFTLCSPHLVRSVDPSTCSVSAHIGRGRPFASYVVGKILPL